MRRPLGAYVATEKNVQRRRRTHYAYRRAVNVSPEPLHNCETHDRIRDTSLLQRRG
jgi:hypothetical protein